MADAGVLSTSIANGHNGEDVEMADAPTLDTAPGSATADGDADAPWSRPEQVDGGAEASLKERVRQRPKLDLPGVADVTTGSATTATGARKPVEREKRQRKSIFGAALGTLARAKVEEKQRQSSEAAKKRQEIDGRIQAKRARELDITRKQEESRKDQIAAKRKQEDLSIKDSILKHRASVLPDLSNYLLTSDIIPSSASDDQSTTNIPLLPSATHKPKSVPALYYLPKILLPSQEAFIERRKTLAQEAVQTERDEWDKEKAKGLKDVRELRESAEAARASVNASLKVGMDGEVSNGDGNVGAGDKAMEKDSHQPSDAAPPPPPPQDQDMEMANTEKPAPADSAAVSVTAPTPTAHGAVIVPEAVDDEAVEY
ncbi:hypothetical protein DL93DRAFT_2088225 [Clavulina sp. PMI_390]|nr:hypothetical protein DL93DRAFT_2088225 [Clavulina sp. PMI_390]